MTLPEKWIWLDSRKYPECQTTKYAGLLDDKDFSYTVAEFKREYVFGKTVKKTELRFSGDTAFELYLGGKIIATGPVPVGGDFLGNEMPRGQHYASEMTLEQNTKTLSFYARVKMGPVGIYEYSQGHGGFMLSCRITFEDGTKKIITTDETWLARRNNAYSAPFVYDERLGADSYIPAAVVPNIWHAKNAPLPMLSENVVKGSVLSVAPHSTQEFTVEFDRIYAALLAMRVKSANILEVEVTSYELEIDHRSKHEKLYFIGDGEYRGFQVHSVGALKLTVTNRSSSEATVETDIISVCYPVDTYAKTVTSDNEMNNVLDVCAHTLKYCRQHIHLDSPCHYEPLACTGDYYIESLMTAFSFGDMRLAEFDIIRTAELLRNNGGRMFHTTYSLIWVMMLNDVYKFTGNRKLLEDCKDALIMLLDLFETYVGDNGIIDDPPDYMFVDWLYIDENSMHHPPKALGQTCLNMFYYGALKNAAEIYGVLGDTAMESYSREKAEKLKTAVNSILFDSEKQMYFEGLNTKSPEDKIRHYHPQNVEKRYYMKHANILACYVEICEKDLSKSLLRRIMSNDIEGDYQAYFAHYLLEAVYRNGLRDEFTLSILEQWKPHVAECSKGLTEGFFPPEPDYSFDHSHAWGGTPLYSLPLALTGLEMIRPGFEEIRLSPSLLGLKEAVTQIPTPYGMIKITQKEGCEPVFDIPEKIKIAR